MKKLIPVLIVSLVLFLGFLFREQFVTYFSDDNDFRIADTAAVSRIEIESDGNIILTRQGDQWIVNGDAAASTVAVNNFLFSFHRISIKGISSNPDISDAKGFRIKIFEGRRKHLLRFYDLGGVSLMHKEGALKLYAVEVNGFPGINMPDIISSDPDHWKDRTLLNLMPGDIREVSVLHRAQPEKDFIIRISEGRPVLFDGIGNLIPEKLTDQEKLNFYISYFTNIFYDYTEKEGIGKGVNARWILKLTDSNGKEYELKVFPLFSGEAEDMFKAMVIYNDQPGFKITRYMVLDLVLQEKEHFLSGENTP